jgi:hypothetical protein
MSRRCAAAAKARFARSGKHRHIATLRGCGEGSLRSLGQTLSCRAAARLRRRLASLARRDPLKE